MNAVIFDLEIIKAIPDRDGSRIPGIEYCAGWGAHDDMGISCIGAWDCKEEVPRIFLKDNFQDFLALCDAREFLVSFNGFNFDHKVLRGSGLRIDESKAFDLLRETWAASGLGPDFSPRTHGGFGLEAICQTNFGMKKTGNGALAPVLWQQGKFGAVIDYCMNDIAMTLKLFRHAVVEAQRIKCPKTGRLLTLAQPKSKPVTTFKVED